MSSKGCLIIDNVYRIERKNLGLIRLDTEESRMMTLGHSKNESGNEINNLNLALRGSNTNSGLETLHLCK